MNDFLFWCLFAVMCFLLLLTAFLALVLFLLFFRVSESLLDWVFVALIHFLHRIFEGVQCRFKQFVQFVWPKLVHAVEKTITEAIKLCKMLKGKKGWLSSLYPIFAEQGRCEKKECFSPFLSSLPYLDLILEWLSFSNCISFCICNFDWIRFLFLFYINWTFALNQDFGFSDLLLVKGSDPSGYLTKKVLLYTIIAYNSGYSLVVKVWLVLLIPLTS
jgi:hypothetical protein